jgi:hypothetical protein
VSRLVAYGRARIAFLFGHLAISCATIGRNRPVPGSGGELTRIHLRMLLPQVRPEIADLDNLAVQFATALEGLLLLALYVLPPETAKPSGSLADSWQTSSRTSAGTDGRKPRRA